MSKFVRRAGWELLPFTAAVTFIILVLLRVV